MEDISFDINSILSGEEAEKFFEEENDAQAAEQETTKEPEDIDNTDNTEENNSPAEDEPDREHSESVGGEEGRGTQDSIHQEGDGSSPLYSSMAKAFRTDGIFPDLADADIDAVQTADDFAELVEKAITSRFDERQRRMDEALRNGVKPDTVKMYEQTLQYLGSINEDVLSGEGDEAENLRRQMIFNDLLNKGFSEERANREVEKSFKASTDVNDAKDALASLMKYYNDGYDAVRKEAKDKAEEQKRLQKESAEKLKKSILEDEIKLGDTVLDKKTCQKIFDSVYVPSYKDPDSGKLLTQVQKFQKENPIEFLKQLGMWFVLTEGGKNIAGAVKSQIRQERNKGIRELERKINSSSLNPDGSLRYASGALANNDPLLSDGWEVDFGKR